ncbi:MAG: DUF2357 domain-containing protein [Bacillota bacterium]
MAQSSSGVKLWDESMGVWIVLEDAYLEEAHQYEIIIPYSTAVSLMIHNMPLPLVKEKDGWKGVFTTPFQSGFLMFELVVDSQHSHRITQYVYPDKRKITQNQFQFMLTDILNEAKVCFEISGLSTEVNTLGQIREPSYLQWLYIHYHFSQLKRLFLQIEENPLKQLEREKQNVKPEKMKEVRQSTINWLDKYGPSQGYTDERFPKYVMTIKSRETYDCYENRVLLDHLIELKRLLRIYVKWNNTEVANRSKDYLVWLDYALKSPFLREVQPLRGSKVITQSFRKHPLYRMWFDWFYSLYEFKHYHFNWSYPIGLKNTYEIYEIWCYVQILKYIRENNLLETTTELFVRKDDQLFLNLAEGNTSKVRLKNGGHLYYQRRFNSKTKPYYTYTQEMIPDIVVEFEDSIVIFDPKYRVEQNLTHALAEMHQYRDGILHKDTEERSVKAVYVLCPVENDFKIFKKDYHQKYKMGAVKVAPGEENQNLQEILNGLIINSERD